MSPQQALLEPHGERLDSHQQLLKSYKSIADICKELVPLEKKVLDYNDKFKEGKLPEPERPVLKRDMERVLSLYDQLEQTSKDIRELTGQIHPNERSNEIKKLEEFRGELLAQAFRAHMNNQTDFVNGCAMANDKLEEHLLELKSGWIEKELSKHKLI